MARKPAAVFNVTLNAVALDAEASRARALRARELLEGSSWVIDEYLAGVAREWLGEVDPAMRERLHVKVGVATDLKADLLSIVDRHLAEEKEHERRKPRSPDDHA